VNFDLTPDARVDLLDIANSIARDNPERAVTYIAELLDHTALVAEQPGIFACDLNGAMGCGQRGLAAISSCLN